MGKTVGVMSIQAAPTRKRSVWAGQERVQRRKRESSEEDLFITGLVFVQFV
jgi:hypothetical protein